MTRPVESYHPWHSSAAGTCPAFGMGDGLFQTPQQGLKGFEPSTKGCATITNQCIQSPSLWKMADWLLSGWKAIAEIEIRSCNSISICYCNSISLLSPLTPGLLRFHVPLTPHLYLKSGKKTRSHNMWHHATVLPKDPKYPPVLQHRDNWNALPSTQESMFLLHLHSTWTVNLTSSHNNRKHFQQLSKLIYSDPYRANFLKGKCINLQLRVA